MQPFVVALLLHFAQPNQAPAPIAGTVADPQGRTVINATVRLEVAGRAVEEVRTGSDGRFELQAKAAGDSRLVVSAPGFAEATIALTDSPAGPLTIVLEPAPFFESVQVTSSRGEAAQIDYTAPVSVLSSSELLAIGAMSLDDALKMMAAFTLSPSSRVSSPTSQTVMLRGLGGAGITRSLVLVDGVPLNDAFGGWMYWNKVPQAAIDRIEVLRGGASDLYGADAVGGVVQILTLRPASPLMRALVEGGSLGTGRISIFGGGAVRNWKYGVGGQWFTTDGYITVAAEDRGSIETPAGSTHTSGIASLSYKTEKGWRFDMHGNVFSERRGDGTPVQKNATSSRQGSAEAEGSAGAGLLSARVFGSTQGYDQTFSELSAEPPRASELLSGIQRVPTRVVGWAVKWVRPGAHSSLLVGTEGRFIKGEIQETAFTGGTPAASSVSGGIQRFGSAFARGTFTASEKLTLVIGAHADGWRSESRSGQFSQTIGVFSPRAAFSYRAAGGIVVHGSAYSGFRPPTPNELYRGAQVGHTIVNANEALRPEKLKGADAGLLFSRGRVSTSVTGFVGVLNDTIINVTRFTSPATIIRQRQNADRMRSAGVEAEADVHLPGSISVGFTSDFTNSRFKGETALRNLRVPDVPAYNIGLNVHWGAVSWTASGQLRLSGSQYDDDVNTLALRRGTVLDVFVGRRIAGLFEVFAAVENLFDGVYDVRRIPTRIVGLPRAARVGFRINLPSVR